ncbi:mitochondrial FAD-linked sulfhydryl oxidase-like protein ERV1 [Melanomma pulvis-pyrius CBS 109.77]|uniref:Sulfhydryl oxidase n=1 Tax=Melanomma pulvis-pyrius CBS 109.77 TaxID=1314802 RepID=A0A6A6XVW2_9PLEO|nr:mitochondrial FAD-linked sulfhydryl oxidase-like protein ERV1 [Melanomma pulvis-pyrius CBS 109.77]
MAPGPVGQSTEQKDDAQTEAVPKKLAKGVVLGPDGKPCRTCTDISSLFAVSKSATSSKSTLPPKPPADCPPDIVALGRSSWTLLHSITATYPTAPSPELQSETKTFIHTFSKLYPCWHCASDFQMWLKEDRNTPRVSSRAEFGQWMCEAHNAVNVKLGKKEFDCNRWEERWKTGWKDGRCD